MQTGKQCVISNIVSVKLVKMNSTHRLNIILNHLHGTLQPSARITSSTKYIYTLDNNLLTNEQRAFYEENGYLIIRNLVDHQTLDECKNRFIDICNGTVERGKIFVMKEKSAIKTGAKGEYLISKIEDLLYDDVFIKYVKYPAILKYLECFTGPKITAIQSLIINKLPFHINQAPMLPMHQDLFYFPIRPANRIVGVWTAMGKVTVDNGCLFVVPGSHKTQLQPHEYPEYDVNFMIYEVQGFDSVRRVHLEMEKGDTVFMHPLLCHGSGSNITKDFRKAIACMYASSDCHYIDKTGVNQETFKKDIKKSMKLGEAVPYQDILKSRQRLINGKPGALPNMKRTHTVLPLFLYI